MDYKDIKEYLADLWPYMKVVTRIKEKKQMIDDSLCEMFSSYSYLGMHSNNQIQSKGAKVAYACSSGNHGPRMLYGNTQQMISLERKLCDWLNKEKALVASSGYMACMSCSYVACLFHDVVYIDEKCHNSIVSGCILSKKRFVKFRHNDYRDLKKKMELSWGKTKAVIIESVYSMDGTIGDLPAIKNICTQFEAMLIVDEAHGLGALGEFGRGLEEYYNMPGSADVIVGTFSKSFSSVGGYIVSNTSFIDKCEYYAMSNVFTAGMSAYHCSIVEAVIDYISCDTSPITSLHYNTQLLRNALEIKGFDVIGHKDSHVVPIVYKYDVLRMLKICKKMKEAGYAVAPICPPACSFKYPRLRITATSWQTMPQIEAFVTHLKMVERDTPSTIDEGKLYWVELYSQTIKFIKSLKPF